MLVLSRRVGEEIIINDNIRITVVAVKGDRIRLGIAAPKDVTVDRAEIHVRRKEFDDDKVSPITVPANDSEVPLGACTLKGPDDTLSH